MHDAIRAIEERAFNAWPALETRIVNGWLLRFAEGYTKRANSINAWRPETPIEAIIEHAAVLYRARNLPVVARLSPLAGEGADATLANLGFLRADETIVMTAPLVRRPARPLSRPLAIDPRPTDRWSADFAGANAISPDRRQLHDRMLANIAAPAAFATLGAPGATAAWGLAVGERGMVGLFDIVTARQSRRQGAARELVAGLLAWAESHGAEAAYLQVVATNIPAIALYQSLGFTEAYRYHYRIAP